MKKLPGSFLFIATVPFVLLALIVSFRLFSNTGLWAGLLITYAAVVISFLSGVHWGIAIHQYHDNHTIGNLLIGEGIAAALIAWGSIIYAGIYIQILVLTLLYSLMWAIDSLLYNRDLIPQWFFTLRSIITPIVVVSLYVAYFGLV